jgi:hypothetical protein
VGIGAKSDSLCIRYVIGALTHRYAQITPRPRSMRGIQRGEGPMRTRRPLQSPPQPLMEERVGRSKVPRVLALITSRRRPTATTFPNSAEPWQAWPLLYSARSASSPRLALPSQRSATLAKPTSAGPRTPTTVPSRRVASRAAVLTSIPGPPTRSLAPSCPTAKQPTSWNKVFANGNLGDMRRPALMPERTVCPKAWSEQSLNGGFADFLAGGGSVTRPPRCSIPAPRTAATSILG